MSIECPETGKEEDACAAKFFSAFPFDPESETLMCAECGLLVEPIELEGDEGWGGE